MSTRYEFCHNCQYFESEQGECRAHAPHRKGFPEVSEDDWCGEYVRATNQHGEFAISLAGILPDKTMHDMMDALQPTQIESVRLPGRTKPSMDG